MAFSKKTWKDRVSQYINRRLLTDSDGNTQQVTVTRDEGSVTETGDAFSAANMNDLEDRIDNAFDGLTAADIPYSAGVSVADKLDEIVANANTIHQYTASYTHASVTQGNIYAYSVGKIYMLTGYMRANAQIANNTVIGSVTGVTLANEIFASSIGENGTGLRLLNYSDGRFRIERAMPANEWFSYTIVGFLA